MVGLAPEIWWLLERIKLWKESSFVLFWESPKGWLSSPDLGQHGRQGLPRSAKSQDIWTSLVGPVAERPLCAALLYQKGSAQASAAVPLSSEAFFTKLGGSSVLTCSIWALGEKKRSKTPHCNVELGKDRRCPTWKKKASLYSSGALEPSGSCGGGGLFFSSKFALSHLRSFSSKPLHFSLLDLDSQSREDPTGYRSYFLLKVILGGASMPDKPHIL